VQIVVKTSPETVAKIHITDRIDSFREMNTAWNLAISVCPVVLNTFHVPLVDHNNDCVSFSLINLTEKLGIFFIY